ncbi:unnamed protein product [Clonostachys rhizophaga]|uniref:Uncharacterized protein n=1 Tax=Clonostachys rhizophaga TaxID=160324 RepID=A0A9N9VM42_9HYPO|nr:unnamed protein product [Clonostachys rhizophaga]
MASVSEARTKDCLALSHIPSPLANETDTSSATSRPMAPPISMDPLLLTFQSDERQHASYNLYFANPNEEHSAMSETDSDDDLAETPPAQLLPQPSHGLSSFNEYNQSEATNVNTPRASRDQLGSAQASSGRKRSRNPTMNEVSSAGVVDDEAPRHAQAEQHAKSTKRPRRDSTQPDINSLDVQDQRTMTAKNVPGNLATISQPAEHHFNHLSGAEVAEILSQVEKSRQTTQSQLDLLKAQSHTFDKRLIDLTRDVQSVIRQQSRMLNEVDDLRKDLEEVKTALQDKLYDLEEDKIVMRNHLEEVTRDWMDENILNRQPTSVTITCRRRRD